MADKKTNELKEIVDRLEGWGGHEEILVVEATRTGRGLWTLLVQFDSARTEPAAQEEAPAAEAAAEAGETQEADNAE